MSFQFDIETDLASLLQPLQIPGPDMLVDGYDQYTQDQEVVDITPEYSSEEANDSSPLRADDCMSSPVFI